MRPRHLPSGTLTLVFTDVEGSTRLLQQLGDGYRDVLAEHRRLVRHAFAAHHGVEVDMQGDAFFGVFERANDALAAAEAARIALVTTPMRVRIGIHTGTPVLAEEGYVGVDVHRAARIAAAGHGGQVLISEATRGLVDRTDVRDLGVHRLKDLSAPQRIFQLGDGDFPPLRTLHYTNLPVPLTPFLGRKRQLADVIDLLSDREVRLLSLTGPGGVGKTRLAVQAAAEVSESFPDGIWWVSLASLEDPRLVLESASLALGATRALSDFIGDKRIVLIFDNFEHLVDAAADLSALLRACPNLRVVVTSRQTLRITGELEYPVPELEDREAAALFCERAGVEPTASVTQLCQRLDGMPLAIELAAARAKMLSPEQLLERLSDRFELLKGGRDADPRQQTLRATMDWSYRLLSSDEQNLFARLAVFSGSWTLPAAEQICDADIDTLQSLFDNSLIRRREGRFGMLETIREFAAEHLSDDERFTWERRHALWFTELVERYLGDGQRLFQIGIPAEVTAEQDNIRRALTWAWTRGFDDLGLRLGATCARYWGATAQFASARAWLDEALLRIPQAEPALQLRTLKAAGETAYFVLADTDAAARYWEGALALAKDLKEEGDISLLLDRRAFVLGERGDRAGALELYQRNLAVYQGRGDRYSEASSLHFLGEWHRDAGDYAHAAELLGRSLAIGRELRSEHRVMNTLHSLGDLALDSDDLEGATGYYSESLQLAVSAGDQRGVAYCLAGLGCVRAERGRLDDAARLWGAVSAAEERLGFRMLASERRRYESRLGRFEATPAWSVGKELALEDAASLGLPS